MNEKEAEKSGGASSIVNVIDDKTLCLDPKVRHGHQHGEQLFAFDLVFGPDKSQQYVYERTAKTMLDG